MLTLNPEICADRLVVSVRRAVRRLLGISVHLGSRSCLYGVVGGINATTVQETRRNGDNREEVDQNAGEGTLAIRSLTFSARELHELRSNRRQFATHRKT